MAEMSIAKLQRGREKAPICVKVMRKWIIKEMMGQELPLYAGLVLADANGHAIYAEIPRETMQSKEPLLEVDKIYIISKFMVSNMRATYKPFDARLMIEFTDFTTISLTRDHPGSFPLYIYKLTPFPNIVASDGPVNTYTDVIGYITKYTSASSRIPRGKERPTVLREIFIKDMSDNELKITLWGENATSFSIGDVYNSHVKNVVVILFVGCLPRKTYNDPNSYYLSGSSACSYYLNPNIEEAQPFYNRFQEQSVFTQQPTEAEEQVPIQTEIAPLPQMTIAELNNIDPFDFEEKGYKCTVTISGVSTSTNWWYIACRECKKKSEPQIGGGHRCPKCQSTAIMHRYLLNFSVRDSTAEANFFAYDEIAKQIVQKDCESILNPLRITNELPEALQAIVSKRFTFSITLTERSFTSRSRRQYLVNSILDRPQQEVLSSVKKPGHVAIDVNMLLPQQGSTQTPAPHMDINETPEKGATTRLSHPTTQARRRLFKDNLLRDKETLEEEDTNLADSDYDDYADPSDLPLSRLQKRSKTTSSKTHGKHV